MRAAEVRLLAAGLVPARSVRHAAEIVRNCERLLAGPLDSRARTFVEFNLGVALAEAMPATDTQQHINRALSLLRRVAGDPSVDPAITVRAAVAIADVANAHAAITGDLGTYEAAVLAAEEIAERLGRPGDGVSAQILMQSAALLHAQASEELAAAVTGTPGMQERARATVVAALGKLARAEQAGAGGTAELHQLQAGLLSQLATDDQDLGTHDQAIAEARAATELARRESVVQQAFAALIAAVVFEAAVDDGADPALLDEALGQVRQALRHRHDDQVRARLMGRQASLSAARDGSWSARQVDMYRRAFELDGGSPFGAISRAREWGEAAAEAGLAAQAAEAYLRGLAVLRSLLSERLTRRFRAGPLREGRDLPAEAAFWLVRQGKLEEAAVVLEMGKAVSATQVIEREAIEAELRGGGHMLIADQYAAATGRLGTLERASPAGESQLSAGAQRHARDLEDAQREYLGMQARIQVLDGFGGAFRPADFAGISRAARARPVVYVTAAARGGHALLISAAGARAIDLPGLTASKLTWHVGRYREGLQWLRQGRAAQWRARLAEMLGWLSMVTEPLWAALGPTESLTIVPAGPLTLLPLHVAGAAAGPAIAFAPNARIVASLSGRQPGRAPIRALVIDHPAPEWGMSEREAAAEIAAVRSSAERVRVLSGANATRDCVLAELPYWNAFHFTCHGRADDDDPLASGLQLQDGVLTVRDILACRVQGARIAVLAACETSIPHSDLFDEVAGLPVALMEAGIPGVIGALWEIDPRASLLVVRQFYQRWDLGEHPAVALQQAQRWLRDATNGDLQESGDIAPPERQLTGAAERAWRSERPYAHPDAWAGFTYTGI